jgi:hypothetical protein
MKTKTVVFLMTLFGLLFTMGTAWAEVAGRVLVAVGDVSAIRAGKSIPLKFGSEVNAGDTLRTGPTSNAQVRLTDGGIIALRPQSEFRLDDYHFPGQDDGSEKGFFSLLKGGFRTVTGLIGKRDKSLYKVTTPVASIGIRGTNYNLVLCQQDCSNADGSKAKDGLYGAVADGKIAVSNEGGSKDFANDEFFYVATTQTMPQSLVSPPDFLADKLEGQVRNENKKGKEDTQVAQAALNFDGRTSIPEASNFTSLETNAPYVVSENTNASGGSAVISTSSPQYSFTVAYGPLNGSYSLGDVDNTTYWKVVPAAFGPGSTNFWSATSFNGYAITSYDTGTFTGTAGTSYADPGGSAAAGNMYWGRWLDGSVNSTGYHGLLSGFSLQSGVHYIFGDATSSDVVAGMSGAVTYTYIGGTHATDQLGNVGSLVSGTVGVDFTARNATPNFSYSVGGVAYNISGFTLPISYNYGAGQNNVGGAAFSGILTNQGSCSTCGGTISNLVIHGGFTGTAAQGLAVSVATYSSANTQSTAVAAAFQHP